MLVADFCGRPYLAATGFHICRNAVLATPACWSAAVKALDGAPWVQPGFSCCCAHLRYCRSAFSESRSTVSRSDFSVAPLARAEVDRATAWLYSALRSVTTPWIWLTAADTLVQLPAWLTACCSAVLAAALEPSSLFPSAACRDATTAADGDGGTDDGDDDAVAGDDGAVVAAGEGAAVLCLCDRTRLVVTAATTATTTARISMTAA